MQRMSLFGVLDGGGLGQDAHRALGRAVRRGRRTSLQASDGRDVDDGTAASLTHRRDRGLRSQEHSLAVDIHDAVPILAGRVFHARAYEDARVVHQDVQLAVCFDGPVHRVVPLGLAGNVQVDVCGVAAGLSYLGFDLPAKVVQDVANDHARPFAGEQFRFDRSLTSRSPLISATLPSSLMLALPSR